jgi:hypothetical protein
LKRGGNVLLSTSPPTTSTSTPLRAWKMRSSTSRDARSSSATTAGSSIASPTHMLAFEGDSRSSGSRATTADYEADRRRRLGAEAASRTAFATGR